MNNKVKYEDLIIGSKLAKDLGVRSLVTKNNSQLMVSQVNRTYETKFHCLGKYLEKAKKLLESYDNFKLERIPRSKNDCTNAFTKLASMKNSSVN